MANLRKYFIIGAGAFLGATARYWLGSMSFLANGVFPWKTLTINLFGSLVLAFIVTLTFEIREIDADLRLGLTSGLLGAFTTFSAFCKESVLLMQSGEWAMAIAYMLLSVVLGLLMAWLGVLSVRLLFGRRSKERASE